MRGALPPFSPGLPGLCTLPRRMRPSCMRALFSGVLALLSLADCSARPVAPHPSLQVLFVGNSLTYTNDLPRLVADIARADGRTLEPTTVAYPNYSLADHLLRGEAAARIAQGGWDFVVLQQGPSALPESRVELIASVRQFAALCSQAGAGVALYGVWPSADRATAFDSVTTSYAVAADSVRARLLPAGRAWQLAWQRDPTLPLYGPDGFHPSAFGSYLAALVIYRGLTHRSPRYPPTTWTIGGAAVTIPPGRLAILNAAATEAVP
jgi:hypothetical protein